MDYEQPDCIEDWLGDGKCNKANNNERCYYDKGDCCAYSCKLNCKEINEKKVDIRNETFFI